MKKTLELLNERINFCKPIIEYRQSQSPNEITEEEKQQLDEFLEFTERCKKGMESVFIFKNQQDFKEEAVKEAMDYLKNDTRELLNDLTDYAKSNLKSIEQIESTIRNNYFFGKEKSTASKNNILALKENSENYLKNCNDVELEFSTLI